MSDFRVALSDDQDGNRELDWSEAAAQWRRSERDFGGIAWVENLTPSSEDLRALLDFFYVASAPAGELLGLRSLSPGQLAAVHQEHTTDIRCTASLCPACGKHWIVNRSDDGGQWRKYGRTCDFSWHRGLPIDPPAIESTSLVRGAQ